MGRGPASVPRPLRELLLGAGLNNQLFLEGPRKDVLSEKLGSEGLVQPHDLPLQLWKFIPHGIPDNP